MKYIITGGGTGGHISPALAIADIIKEDDIDASILYIGSENSMESELVPKKKLRFYSIKTGFINRKLLSYSNIKTILYNIIGLFQAIKIIKIEKPDLIIGTGGFVAGPVVLAGKLCKIKTIIHEQNTYPGITNKLLSRIVDLVMTSFIESNVFFKSAKEVTLVGNPVRKDLFDFERDDSRKNYNVKEDEFFIYSFGGSGGQNSLNNSIIELISMLKNEPKIKLLHVTGKRLYKNFTDEMNEKKLLPLTDNIVVVDYMYDAPKVLSACDLVIGSAGAITIAEITSLGLVSILIPKAYTSENHQEKNAKTVEKHGAAFVFSENDITGFKIYNTIKELIENEDLFTKMSNQSIKLSSVNAKKNISEAIGKVLTRRNHG